MSDYGGVVHLSNDKLDTARASQGNPLERQGSPASQASRGSKRKRQIIMIKSLMSGSDENITVNKPRF